MSLYLVIVIFLSACGGLHTPQSTNKKENRVALVIANQHYTTNPLINPINDAKAITRTLKKLGFEVIYEEDVSQTGFHQALQKFKSKINRETTTLFYFSGHANTIQNNSTETFFQMVDKKKNVIVSIHKLYETLREANGKNNIVCIDACRNYVKTTNDTTTNGVRYRGVDFHKSEYDATRIIDSHYPSTFPNSTLLSYATFPNEEARDSGIHDPSTSPYAYYLSRYLDDEDVSILEVFRRVREKMNEDFNGKLKNSEGENSLIHGVFLQDKRAIGSPTIPG